ncbi:HdeD family acid-resistance protein [Streptomyces genisteinicus]|uniref:DUF308 domain-containing protein n=1 Tax=Streptomyces genisteinicus TaxID=2768068 RepID=A0A7H0I0C0_9ACTN|nr:DUF308 domain-containing protein [Streptomyces genisteinicus]QNP66236.1 DUF308 domain-containing protein [Streptomyces genisteinicus]
MTASRDAGPAAGRDTRAGGTAEAAPPGELLGRVGASWTWLLGSALVSLVPGVMILAWPDGTLHVLGVVTGLYLLVAGGFRFVAAFAQERGQRTPGLLMAVVYVLAGVLCLRHPLQTVTALSLIVGLVWLVTGMLTLYTALAADRLPHRGFVVGAGALGIVAGIVVLALPAESALFLIRLLGLWLILLGLVELGLALAWRAASRRAAAVPPAG